MKNTNLLNALFKSDARVDDTQKLFMWPYWAKVSPGEIFVNKQKIRHFYPNS